MSVETNTDEGQPAEGGTGRPRPQDTIARDNAVHKTLTAKGPLTRKALAEELNITPSLAYMSLFRLRTTGRVRRVADENSKSHTWEAVPTQG